MTETTETMPNPPAGHSPGAEARRLSRARDGRWLGGVCDGLGRYFGLSPMIYRIGFVALSLAGGTGILLYVAAWLVMPDDGVEDSIAAGAPFVSLADDKGKRYLVPTSGIAYVELGSEESRRVGFFA